MSKSFEVKLKGDPEAIIAKAKVAAKNKGVDFEGNGQAGNFSGLGIEGSYSIQADTMAVEITKKPFVMPWSLIESSLRDYFA
ncbi:hypothetical protein SAMN02949497_4474 [Methylomagnum ishizawai]|uniref:Uncharacterized protein n=1 Tax=Methylomagnum ishizawai TaxID=1760988 RepID=A0A1Y6D284_9GAMM|nr:hypothetical protein [Methylomagnum ishizawai]SMF97058.1 hypothetical protein SAMN02949497_4474 [Methylomagnum ishizawai]